MSARQLNIEECHLLTRAQANGYVTTDQRDGYDVVAEAYREWCRAEKLPFLEIALGDETSRVTFSLIEAGSLFSEETEMLLRSRLADYCLYVSEIVVEDDYCLAERVLNERITSLLAWLLELSTEQFPAFL